MNVLFLHTASVPITYYRIVQFADKMREIEGINPMYPKIDLSKPLVTIREWEQDIDKFIPDFSELFEMADIVVCQNVHSLQFLSALEAFKSMHNFILLMESDDDPFEIDAANPAYNVLGVGSTIEQNCYDQIKLSDGAIVSTDYLKYSFSRYTKNVHVVPNALDFYIWDPYVDRPREKDPEKIVIGWAGAAGHEKDLSLVRSALIELLEEIPNLHIKCLHGALDFIEHERFYNENVWTNIHSYPEKLTSMGFDIAIAPLWDSEFNRSKSNLRFLEYSALGIPTVASPVEPYKKAIIEGETGYFAVTKKNWLDKLKLLIYNPTLRVKIGSNAYSQVKKQFNLTAVTQDYADLLKRIYKERKANVDIPGTTK